WHWAATPTLWWGGGQRKNRVLEKEEGKVGLPRVEGGPKGFRRGREEVLALDDVDLCLDAGGFTALVGPSGSGKSTLLHLAGGLDKPDAGRILLEDRDLSALSAGERAQLRRRQLGFVFQFFHLIPTLTVTE